MVGVEKNKYQEVVVAWSEEDLLYIARHPQHAFIVTHGETEEEARKEIYALLDWIAKEEGGRV